MTYGRNSPDGIENGHRWSPRKGAEPPVIIKIPPILMKFKPQVLATQSATFPEYLPLSIFVTPHYGALTPQNSNTSDLHEI